MIPNNKTVKIGAFIMSLALVVGLYFASHPVNAENEPVMPDKAVIAQKVHIKKLKSFNQNSTEVENYLASLTTKGLLETAAELANEGENVLAQQGVILTPYLKKKWSNGVPSNEMITLIKDKANNKEFRAFLIDGFEKKKAPDQIDHLADTLISIGSDKMETENIRRFSLLKLRQLSINPKKQKSQRDALISLFNDPQTPSSVKGAIISSLNRSKAPEVKDLITTIMSNPTQYEGIILRHAIFDGVSGKHYTDVVKIQEIARTTDDSEVYGTAILAFSMLKGEAVVKAVLSNFGRFDNSDIGRIALLANQKAVLSMLDINQSPSNILAGIEAAEIIKIHSANDKLNNIISDGPTEETRTKAELALTQINNYPKSGFPSNSEKWEDN